MMQSLSLHEHSALRRQPREKADGEEESELTADHTEAVVRQLDTLAIAEALLHWLTGSVMLVSGVRLDANCPVGTVGFVVNLCKVLHLTCLIG